MSEAPKKPKPLKNNDTSSDSLNLTGKTLIATPSLQGSFFEHAVIYICAHCDTEGTIGLILAKTMPDVSFHKIADELKLKLNDPTNAPTVHCGGPVDPSRGFILHSPDILYPDSHPIDPQHALTTNIAVLNDIALGKGPKNAFFALGYAGWDAGQLEQELRENSWLTSDLLEPFALEKTDDTQAVWEHALHQIGISPTQLSQFSGSA